MPRGVYERKKKPVSDTKTEAPEISDPDEAVGDLCAEGCFPVGWPEDAYSAGCEHGTWTRQADAEQDDEGGDDGDGADG